MQPLKRSLEADVRIAYSPVLENFYSAHILFTNRCSANQCQTTLFSYICNPKGKYNSLTCGRVWNHNSSFKCIWCNIPEHLDEPNKRHLPFSTAFNPKCRPLLTFQHHFRHRSVDNFRVLPVHSMILPLQLFLCIFRLENSVLFSIRIGPLPRNPFNIFSLEYSHLH